MNLDQDNSPENNHHETKKTVTTRSVTKKTVTIAAVVAAVVLVIAIGAVLVSRDRSEPVPDDTPRSILTPDLEPATITITADGFIPAAVTIAPGQAVIWTNEDGAPHAVAADPHPEHDSLTGLDSGPIDQDGTYEFTFDEAGVITYHDEFDPTVTGTVTVE